MGCSGVTCVGTSRGDLCGTVRCGWRQGRRLGNRPESEVKIDVRATLTDTHHERRSGCIWNVCVRASVRLEELRGKGRKKKKE